MTDPHFHFLRAEHDHDVYMSSRGARALSISIVFTCLATCFVSARIYTRAKLMRRMEPNDWMILLSLALSYVFMGLFIVEARTGMGMHEAMIPPSILLKQMKAFWLTIPFYNAALLLAKASILMQYFRVFPTRRMRRICWTMIGMLATYGSWAVLSAFLNCIPVAKFWNPTIDGYCLSMEGLWFSNASMHIATDIAILLIPIPAMWGLELPRKQKMALVSIFALGGFVCVTSVCRLVALKQIADSTDATYDNVGAASWSAIECNTGIICACVPTLRPLVSHFLPHLLSTLSGGHTYGQAYGQAPSTHSQAPTFWDGNGTVTTTISTQMEDLEYAHCAGDADRYLTLVPGHEIGGKGKLMVRESSSHTDELREAAARAESRRERSPSP
ncbi:integral membrane protein [Aspergillus ellipticus CBS 707.79]|uniref:Integral membrane protein n=1 Tax=Aspergillus ellipticus CBS 707.79 TaxID=1448320 RepID=A0A319EWY5_9EURO|nr:integral membrane protein [Aspergillus ellipticus CBS 707.79]